MIDNIITLITVNWNQQPALELMLRSYVQYHQYHFNSLLNLVLVDNGSTDGSKEWLRENEIPFIDLPKNLGHGDGVNIAYQEVKTKYVLLCDSDIEFTDSIYTYLNLMRDKCISVGELISDVIFNGCQIKPRISPWFWLFDYQLMTQNGINIWWGGDSSYDAGSWYWEQMHTKGYTNYNLTRKSVQEKGIGIVYDKFNHFGSVSWDLKLFPEHSTEINLRRECIKTRLNLYQEVNLRGKFIK